MNVVQVEYWVWPQISQDQVRGNDNDQPNVTAWRA